MSYTIQQAITKTRELINETTAAFWSDDEIEGWIEEACIDISTKLLAAVTFNQMTLVDGQYRYTTSDHSWIGDCIVPKKVWYDSSAGPLSLQMINDDQFGHLDRQDAEPTYFHYDSQERTFYIFPTPDSSVATDTISVVHSYETDDIDNIRDEYQILTWLYAVHKCKMKERLHQESALVYQLYVNAVNFERRDKYDLGMEPTREFNIPE